MILDAGVLIPPVHAPARDTRPLVLAPYRHPAAELPTDPIAEMRAGVARARSAIARCFAALEEDDPGGP